MAKRCARQTATKLIYFAMSSHVNKTIKRAEWVTTCMKKGAAWDRIVHERQNVANNALSTRVCLNLMTVSRLDATNARRVQMVKICIESITKFLVSSALNTECRKAAAETRTTGLSFVQRLYEEGMSLVISQMESTGAAPCEKERTSKNLKPRTFRVNTSSLVNADVLLLTYIHSTSIHHRKHAKQETTAHIFAVMLSLRTRTNFAMRFRELNGGKEKTL